MSFESAMRALTSDADRWEATATMLDRATADCAAMTLRAQDFTFVGGSAYAAYTQVQQAVEQLLRDGATQTANAAVALRAVHDTYDGSDQAAKDRMSAKWKAL